MMSWLNLADACMTAESAIRHAAPTLDETRMARALMHLTAGARCHGNSDAMGGRSPLGLDEYTLSWSARYASDAMYHYRKAFEVATGIGAKTKGANHG